MSQTRQRSDPTVDAAYAPEAGTVAVEVGDECLIVSKEQAAALARATLSALGGRGADK